LPQVRHPRTTRAELGAVTHTPLRSVPHSLPRMQLLLDSWRTRSTPLLTSISQCTQPMSRDSQVTTSPS
jgi:hypothetical protein